MTALSQSSGRPEKPSQVSRKVFRIIKYDLVHEDAASRKLKKVNYIQFPVRCDSTGWKTLNLLEGGIQAKGVYADIAELAARSHIRGVLASESKPYTLLNIATHTGIPLDIVQMAFEVFQHPDVGFVDEIDWPVDERLIRSTIIPKKGICSLVVHPYTIDSDGRLIDQAGRLIESKIQHDELQYPDRTNSLPDRSNIHLNRFVEYNENESELKEKKENSNKNEACSLARRSSESAGDLTKSIETERKYVRCVVYAEAINSVIGLTRGRRRPHGDKQVAADITVCDHWWENVIWPAEEADLAICQERLRLFCTLCDQARKKDRPMAWLTTMVSKTFGHETVEAA